MLADVFYHEYGKRQGSKQTNCANTTGLQMVTEIAANGTRFLILQLFFLLPSPMLTTSQNTRKNKQGMKSGRF